MSNTNPEAEEFNFADFLAEFGKGATNKLASQRLREIAVACAKTGSKGSLTIKFMIGVVGGVAEVRAKISTSAPEPALPGGIYFATDDGDLVEEDPRQMKLPARILDIQPVRTINNAKPTE